MRAGTSMAACQVRVCEQVACQALTDCMFTVDVVRSRLYQQC